MSRKSLIFIVIAVTAPIFMGANGCSEPKEFCKVYSARNDRDACSNYCSKHVDFARDQSLVRACHVGQLIFLNGIDKDGAAAMRQCDQHHAYASKTAVAACRAGVAAENTRFANYKKSDPGTAGGDRETGNRGGNSQKQRF